MITSDLMHLKFTHFFQREMLTISLRVLGFLRLVGILRAVSWPDVYRKLVFSNPRLLWPDATLVRGVIVALNNDKQNFNNTNETALTRTTLYTKNGILHHNIHIRHIHLLLNNSLVCLYHISTTNNRWQFTNLLWASITFKTEKNGNKFEHRTLLSSNCDEPGQSNRLTRSSFLYEILNQSAFR